MIPILIAAACLLLLVTIPLLINGSRERHTDEEAVIRLRATVLYAEIYPLCRKYDEIWLQSVTFQPDAVEFRVVLPYGWTERFIFAEHGFEDPSPDTLYALAQAAIVDNHQLRNRSRYRFRQLTETRPNGDKRYSYQYLIRKRWQQKLQKMAAVADTIEEEEE